MRILLAQLNPVVGAVEANLARLQAAVAGAREPVDLAVFPELYLTGYPPRDLLERRAFLARVEAALAELARWSARFPATGILVGLPLPAAGGAGKPLHNSAALVHAGAVRFAQHKSLLPTYDVFDEHRHFEPAAAVGLVEFGGQRLGISICEDAWNDPQMWPRPLYRRDPIAELAAQGASLLVNISASPFHAGKPELRFRLLSAHARKHGLPLVFVNQVGGNDELVFDGESLALDARGRPAAVLARFAEEIAVVDTDRPGRDEDYLPQETAASVRDALVLGVRDYLAKCGFARAVLGLSGGIDSALVADLAVEALGPENVLGVTMPSPFSSPDSARFSRQLAANLGIECREIPIGAIYEAYRGALAGQAAVAGAVTPTLENVQARIRGNLLMAISNEHGHLVLTTGNKSELAVGYCTLYGDMAGGLAVIADVPKTMVYALARLASRERERIPPAIIERPPTAELRPNQLDQDSLPPYETLDPILNAYVEEGLAPAEIAARGFDPAVVEWVARAVRLSEHKRRQAAPGLKVTSKAFGMGRRMPIAARFDD